MRLLVFLILAFNFSSFQTSWAQESSLDIGDEVQSREPAQISEKKNLNSSSGGLSHLRLKDWASISAIEKAEIQKQKLTGRSYVVSGSLGFLGGFAGQSVAKDPFEKMAYTVFQSIGIAAIGYGLYQWQLGSEERQMFEFLEEASLKSEEKEKLFATYQRLELQRLKKENKIRAITHSLIALLNIYNASQQDSGVTKDSLFFIGGVNLLAAASYTFEF